MKDLSIKKLYYSISEVSKLTSVEQYILRYWETEFEQLRPQKNRAGNRIYTNKDIDIILKIKTLLRDKKYTIEGAKQILNSLTEQQELLEKEEFNQNSDISVESNSISKNTLKGQSANFELNSKLNEELKKDLKEIKNLLLEIYYKL
jgi:DNA-binding transcriptional MerR regulator